MSGKGYGPDIAGLLYLVPFALSGVYGLYLWFQAGLSAYLPPTVFLTVTRDPTVFILGSLSVMLGVVLDERSADPASKRGRLESLANTVQNIAIASLFLSLLSALYANGFTDVTGAATDFVVGRFAVVFPAMLVLLSYFLTARFGLDSVRNPRVLGLIAMLLVPVTLYEFGRRNSFVGLAGAFLFLVVGVVLFARSTKGKPAPVKQS